MNNLLLRKTGICSGIICLSFLVLFGIFYLAAWLKNDVYFSTADYILKNSEYCTKYKNIKIKKEFKPFTEYSGFFNAVFEDEEKKFDLLFVRVYGKYGPYQALFLYDRQNAAAEYCGLAGISDISKQSGYYGISRLTIEMNKKKIEDAFLGIREGNK